eukprot:9002242-Pyramimonas_sp.AAC.1
MAFKRILLSELKVYKSLHDGNCLCMFDEERTLRAFIIMLHVDDLLFLGMKNIIQWVQQQVGRKFGKLTPRPTFHFAWNRA